MAKRINTKVVLIVCAAVVFFAAAVGGLAYLYLPRDPRPFIIEGDRRMSEGDLTGAIGNYQRALGADPTNVDVLIKLGDAFLNDEQVGRAVQAWRTATVVDTQCVEAQRRICDLYAEFAELRRRTDSWQTLADECTRLLEMDPNDDQAYGRRGRSYSALSRLDPDKADLAEEDFRKALALNPKEPDYHHRLAALLEQKARVLREQQREDEGEELLKEAEKELLTVLEQNPESVDGKVKYAFYVYRRGDKEKALELLEKLAQDNEQSSDAQLALADYWRSENDDERVAHYLAKAAELDPQSVGVRKELATLYRKLRRRDEAMRIIDEALQLPGATDFTGIKGQANRGQRFSLLVDKGMLLLEMANAEQDPQKRAELVDQIQEVSDAAKATLSENHYTHLLDGKVAVLRGDNPAAIKHLKEAEVGFTGRTETALETRVLLAQALARQNQLGEAIEKLEQVLADDAFPRFYAGRIMLARLLIRVAARKPPGREDTVKTYERALWHAQVVLRAQPTNEAAKQVRVAALVALGRDEEAERRMRELADDTEALRTRAQALLYNREYTEALPLLEQIVKRDPNDARTANGLIEVYRRLGMKDKATALIVDQADRHPDSFVDKRRKVLALTKTPEEYRATVLQMLSEIKDELARETQTGAYYLSIGEYDKAAEHLKKAEQLAPHATNVLQYLFSLSLARKDWDDAAHYVNRATDEDLDDAGGKFFQGQYLLAKGDPQKAVEVLRSGLEERDSFAKGWVLLGEAYLKLERVADADEAFSKAYEQDPTNTMGQKGLGFVRYRQGRGDEALQLFEEVAISLPDDPDVKRLLPVLRDRYGDPNEALAYRRDRAESDPSDVANLVRVGELERDAGDLKAALETFKQALGLRPDSAQIAFHLAECYRLTGQPDEGLKVLLKYAGREKTPGSPAAPFILLSEYYANLGQHQDAMANFQKAIQADPNNASVQATVGDYFLRNNQFAAAAQHYKRSIELRDTPDIRSKYVRVLLRNAQYDEAEKEIAAFRRDYPDVPLGRVLTALIDLKNGELDKAIEELNAAIEADPQLVVAYYYRGQTYDFKGDTGRAIENLERARTIDKKFALARVLLGKLRWKRNERDLAIQELRAALEVEPDSYEARVTLARYMFEDKRWEQLEKLFAENRRLMPKDWQWPLLEGNMWKERHQLAKAVEAHRQAVILSGGTWTTFDTYFDTLLQNKQYDEVIRLATEREADLKHPYLHLRVAEAYAGKGDEKSALMHFQRALAASAGKPRFETGLIAKLPDLVGNEAALKWCRDRVQEKPGDVGAQFILAELLLKLRNADEAIGLLEKLKGQLKNIVDQVEIRKRLALAYYLKQDYAKARPEYEWLIQALTPYVEKEPRIGKELIGFENNLAYLLADKLNDAKAAIGPAKSAFERAPQNPNVMDTYAYILMRTGELTEARRILEMAATRRDDAVIRFHLGQVLMQQNRYQRALNEFRTALELLGTQGSPDLTADELREWIDKAEKAADSRALK